MAKTDEKTGRTVAAIGGGALLLWLLLRGKGWGLGASRGEGTGPSSPTLPRCRVRVDQYGVQLDGAPADVATVVARCRETGAADVLATGAAISGVVEALLDALRAAGVVVHLSTPASRTTATPEAA